MVEGLEHVLSEQADPMATIETSTHPIGKVDALLEIG